MATDSVLLVLKDHGSDINITSTYMTLHLEDAGTEEISNAILTLSSKRGRFIKNNITLNGITYPKLLHFDRIFIRLTDRNGNKVNKVMEIMKLKPKRIPGRGLFLDVYLSDQSWYVWQDHFAKQYQRQSGFEVVQDICNSYNANRGTDNPEIFSHDTVFSQGTGKGNAMSKATFNDYDFANAEMLDYDGILEVVDKLGSPVEAGGELEFYEVQFIPRYNHDAPVASDLDKIDLALFPSGGRNSTIKTISKDVVLDLVTETDSNLEKETGTAVFAWGSPDGSLPTHFSIFTSEKEEFYAAKDYDDAITYKTGMRVQRSGFYYVAIQNVPISTPPPNATYWALDSFTPSVDYSPWTKDKSQYWINSACGFFDATNPAGNFSCFDHNMVVRDNDHHRTWVHTVNRNEASIASLYKKGGTTYRRGFRVLCNGTPTGGAFSQNSGRDRFNKSYTNAVIKHNGGTNSGSNQYKNWDVFREAQADDEVVEKDNGRSYTFVGGTWDIEAYWLNIGSTSAVLTPGKSFDCLHKVMFSGASSQFGNVPGLIEGGSYTTSSVYAKYEFNIAAANFESIGAWINFEFPFPPNSNSIPWGAVTLGEKYYPDTLDINNLHLSSNGGRGFNQGIDASNRGAEDFGEISAIAYYCQLELRTVLGATPPSGDWKIGTCFYDTSDNVVLGEAVIPHLNNPTEIIIPINSFKIHRARPGAAFIPLQEIEVLNLFEWRNIIMGSIFTLDSYDDLGRYAGIFSRIAQECGQIGSARIIVDGFRFIKPLLVTTQEETNQNNKPSRNLQPTFLQHPQIFNYVQLKNNAKTYLEIHQFKRVEYVIKQRMRCDVKFGDWLYYTDAELIDETVDAKSNTVKLVAKKVIYDISKGKQGPGGKLTTIMGVKRFQA